MRGCAKTHISHLHHISIFKSLISVAVQTGRQIQRLSQYNTKVSQDNRLRKGLKWSQKSFLQSFQNSPHLPKKKTPVYCLDAKLCISCQDDFSLCQREAGLKLDLSLYCFYKGIKAHLKAFQNNI